MALLVYIQDLTLASFVRVSVKLGFAFVTGQALDSGMAITLTRVRVTRVRPGSDRMTSALTATRTDISESVLIFLNNVITVIAIFWLM